MSGPQQLAAVRDGRLDVAVCRSPTELDERLQCTLVRLDPPLVAELSRHAIPGRPVDPTRRTIAAAHGGDRDADYGAFLTSYERASGCSLQRVPVAAGSGTEAYAIRRAGARAFVTLASRGVRLDGARPVVGTSPIQAYIPWSIVWRRDDRSRAVRAFVRAAQQAQSARRWREVHSLPGTPWIPDDAADAAQPERVWKAA
jgi:hypothetical protein